MRINIKVNESDVKRLALGQKARVTVGAFPGETFAGSVESIAPLPDVIFLSEPDRIVYTTYLLIEKSQVGLRPGMSASAEILIDK